MVSDLGHGLDFGFRGQILGLRFRAHLVLDLEGMLGFRFRACLV